MSVGISALFFYLLPQRPFEGQELNGQWFSVLPPIVAVSAALSFRNLIVALLAAFLTGSFLAFGPNPIVTLPRAFNIFILQNNSIC